MRVLEADPRIGSELAGYRLEALLGRGGMGVVYLAQDPWLEREVALKLVAPERSRDDQFRERFLRESRLAASLEHADVVPIYEAGEAGGHLYLAMRYVAGSDLKSLLEQEGRLDPARALAILERVAVALDAAHAKGLVHRDVKPGNILLEAETDGDVPRHVYLSDFGLTSRAEDEDPAEAGELVGTLDYLAPEQVEGRPVSAETDVYSLGCVLYQCLTGDAPYLRDSRMEVLWAHLEGDPPRPSESRARLPETLDAVIARALAKEPHSRYASCRELVEAARQALGEGAAVKAVPAAAPRNPYKGLRPFGEADADDYFGREALTDALIERLSDPDGGRFVAVVGPSGSGKSSLLKAGLIPRLRRGAVAGSERWTIAELVPGPDPFEELAAALRSAAPQTDVEHDELAGDPAALARLLVDGSELLLVIDQFEELFTMADEDERGRFLASLESAVSEPYARFRLVIALRADFYDRPLRYPEFGVLVEAGQVNLHPLSPGELEQAITGPARAVGVALEPGLVADIVADVAEHPGALPLLQYALTELFEHRESATLTADAYRRIGGVSGALARRAEELYGELDDSGKEAARKLFSRLVTLGEGTEDTRRRVRREEVSAIEDSEVEEVIDGFGGQRLLSFDRDPITHSPTVEIAHEALLREWPRLRAWIDEDRDGLRLLRHLSEAAVAWRKLERDPGELYRGARLEAALAWAKAHPDDLNPLEQEFLDRGRALREEEARAESERIEQRVRQNRRLRIALAVLGIVLVAAVVAGILALRARNNAADARFAAENGRLVAESANVLPKNRRLGFLLAAEAHRREPSTDSLGALQRALTGTLGFLGYFGGDTGYRDAAFSSDGRRLIAVGKTSIEVYNLADARLLRRIELAEPPSAAALSAAGDVGAIAEKGRIRLYAVASGAERGELEHATPATALAFSPNRDRLASGHADGTVVLWHLRSGARARSLKAHSTGIRELTFSPDGSLLATIPMSEQGSPAPLVVRVWDIHSGARVGADLLPPRRAGQELFSGATAIEFGADGTLAASGPLAIRRWDLESGKALGDVRHPGLSGEVDPFAGTGILDFAFVTESTVALSAGTRVTLLDLATGRPIGRVLESQLKIDVNDSSIRNLALAPDGSTLAVWGEDGVALWSLAGRQLLARAFPRRGAAFAFANAEGSRLIASPFFGSPPVAWNMAVDPPARIPFIDKPAVAAFLDNGKVLITNPTHGEARGEEPIRLWDPVTLTPVSALPRAEIAFGMAAHRKAGLLAVGQTPSVKVFDLESGRLVAELDDLDRFQRVEWVPNLSFSPDGRWLVGTSDRGHALVWDTSTWQAVEKPLSTREGEAMFAAYSPNGRYLLTADRIGLLTLRDPESYEPVGDPLVGHRGALVSQGAFFSRDGRRLLTNGPDGARLWDVESRAEIGDTFPADPRDPGAGTPDADAITALGKHLLLWDTETDKWFDIACRAAGRNMTPAEWEEFGPTDERHRATCEQWPVPS